MDIQPPHLTFVVTGVEASGKSTFIQTLSEVPKAPLKPDVVAMDFGKISVEGGVFYLFGMPNGRRFDIAVELLEKSLIGWIAILDSSRPETFAEFSSILDVVRRYSSAPLVVAANFQDHPDAWDAEALQILLTILPEMPVIPCIATDRTSAKHVLLALCEKILENAEEA